MHEILATALVGHGRALRGSKRVWGEFCTLPCLSSECWDDHTSEAVVGIYSFVRKKATNRAEG